MCPHQPFGSDQVCTHHINLMTIMHQWKLCTRSWLGAHQSVTGVYSPGPDYIQTKPPKPLKMQMTWVLGSQHHFALEISSCWDGLLANVDIARVHSPVVQLALSRPWWQIEIRWLSRVSAWSTEYWICYESENYRISLFVQTLCSLQLYLPCLSVNPMSNYVFGQRQLKPPSSST